MGLDEVVLLKISYTNRWESVDWMHLTYGREKWWSYVNTVITL
jgi:hypothetical protein